MRSDLTENQQLTGHRLRPSSLFLHFSDLPKGTVLPMYKELCEGSRDESSDIFEALFSSDKSLAPQGKIIAQIHRVGASNGRQ